MRSCKNRYVHGAIGKAASAVRRGHMNSKFAAAYPHPRLWSQLPQEKYSPAASVYM